MNIQEKINKYLIKEGVVSSKEIEMELKTTYEYLLKTEFKSWKINNIKELDKYFKMLSKNTDKKSLNKAIGKLWSKLEPKRSRDDKLMFTFISFLEDDELIDSTIDEIFAGTGMIT